jgi:hypothetical protein
MEIILVIVGFYVLVVLISWISDKVQSIKEERRLHRRLQTLAQQVASIDIDRENQRLDHLQRHAEKIFSRINVLRFKIMFHKSDEDEQLATEQHKRLLNKLYQVLRLQ